MPYPVGVRVETKLGPIFIAPTGLLTAGVTAPHLTVDGTPMKRRNRSLPQSRLSFRESVVLVLRPRRIPHDFSRTVVRKLERAGVPRSIAMELVRHKTESVYQRYDVVAQPDLSDGVARYAERLAVRPLTWERSAS
jgi:hypothetical protein